MQVLHRGYLVALCLVLGAMLCTRPAVAQALAPELSRYSVALATMEPGTVYWERFGHNALIITERASGEKISINFGYFDFEQPGFLSNFLFGQMEYLGVAFDADTDLNNYLNVGRRVVVQELDLTATESDLLMRTLREQVSEKNRAYRYQYFRNNCSTKLRDALNVALGGALESAFVGRSHGETNRSLALAHAKSDSWMALGMHLALGMTADENLSRYAEFYIPSRLRAGLDDFRRPDGAPLVRETRELLRGEPAYVEPRPPVWWPAFLAYGLLVAWLINFIVRRGKPRLAGMASDIAGILALAFALSGGFIAFLWGFTGHVDAAWNINLFLLNPLWLITAIVLWRSRGSKRMKLFALAAPMLAAIGVFLKVFPFFAQQSIEWVLLFGPIMAIQTWLLLRTSIEPKASA